MEGVPLVVREEGAVEGRTEAEGGGGEAGRTALEEGRAAASVVFVGGVRGALGDGRGNRSRRRLGRGRSCRPPGCQQSRRRLHRIESLHERGVRRSHLDVPGVLLDAPEGPAKPVHDPAERPGREAPAVQWLLLLVIAVLSTSPALRSSIRAVAALRLEVLSRKAIVRPSLLPAGRTNGRLPRRVDLFQPLPQPPAVQVQLEVELVPLLVRQDRVAEQAPGPAVRLSVHDGLHPSLARRGVDRRGVSGEPDGFRGVRHELDRGPGVAPADQLGDGGVETEGAGGVQVDPYEGVPQLVWAGGGVRAAPGVDNAPVRANV